VSILFRRPSAPEARSLSYQSVFGTGADVDLFGSGVAGQLQLIPLFAAQRLIIDQFASTPFHAYRLGAAGDKQRMTSQPQLVSNPSSVGHLPFAWKAQLVASLLSYGNAYGLIVRRDDVGSATGLDWLDPTHVSVDESNPMVPIYYYDGRTIPRSSLLHIPWILQPGKWKGLSPMQAFKVAFETGQSAQISARDWFVNGAIPTGILKNVDRDVSAETAGVAKERFKVGAAGRDVVVLGSEWDYSTIGIPADEARFIEQLKMTATQIASIYGIPAEMIGGETGASMTYSTLEQQSMNFLTYTMNPWFVRVEDALTTLLPQPQYVKFNTDSLVRADLEARMRAHEIALRIGLETQDEGRNTEDRPPLTDEEKAAWMAVYAKVPPPPPPATR